MAPLLVTEDALRRSGIGRVLYRITTHVDNNAVATQAGEILLDWKQRMGHRDPAEERAHQVLRQLNTRGRTSACVSVAFNGMQGGIVDCTFPVCCTYTMLLAASVGIHVRTHTNF